MIYPAQTSFIPVQIALSRFLENQGIRAFFSNYPYWYLGTTPYRFLTGPILPSILVLLHKILPKIDLFSLFFILIGGIWGVGGIGVFLFVRQLQVTEQKKISSPIIPTFQSGSRAGLRLAGTHYSLLITFLYLLGPIAIWLFPFASGLDLISFSILPFVLLFYLNFLQNPSRKNKIICITMISFLLLLDTLILSKLVLGLLTVFLVVSNWQKIEERLKQTAGLLGWSLLLVTIWYTPLYWLQLLKAPSFAGKPGIQVIGQVTKLLPMALAFGLALVSGKALKHKSRLAYFCFYWLFIFGFLTFLRFIADPDFVLDWLSYGLELQLGLALLLGLIIKKIPSKIVFILLITLYSLLFTYLIKTRVIKTLQVDITQSLEYRLGRKLNQLMQPGDRVFVSGTLVFWLNSFFDLAQVRGGVDQASLNPDWRQAAWDIREGEDPAKTLSWLKKLNISWLVVHTLQSQEYYHDFKDSKKFDKIQKLEKVYDSGGDRIYKMLP